MKKFILLFLVAVVCMSATGDNLQKIQHKAFVAIYNVKYRQSELVIYSVTKNRLGGKVSRSIASFQVDPSEKTSHSTTDYTGSGFDRGHLAPAADMTWDETAMKECFYTTNISPQYPGFNRGEWKSLEERVRKEALERDSLVIYVGVIFEGSQQKGVLWVPTSFYKIVYDPKEKSCISFLFPHVQKLEPYSTYVSTLEKVEKAAKREVLNVKKEYSTAAAF